MNSQVEYILTRNGGLHKRIDGRLPDACNIRSMTIKVVDAHWNDGEVGWSGWVYKNEAGAEVLARICQRCFA